MSVEGLSRSSPERAFKLLNFFAQPFFVAEPYTQLRRLA
jgi:F0F1-type ATP synthase beta subunit